MNKMILASILCILLSSCGVVALRSVVYQNFQKAETEGVASNPSEGSHSIQAEKRTELESAVSTSSGSATVSPKTKDE